jgi:hypothetical protein
MILVSVISSLIVGVASSYLTFRLQLTAFMSMDKEREKHWMQWREGISADVEILKRSMDVTNIALLGQRMAEVERRLASIDSALRQLHK